MRGHEYARAQVRNHLLSTVGPRLDAIKESLEVETPQTPSDGSYILADSLPVDPQLYPCVVIMSTGSPRIRRQSVSGSGDMADFIVVYDLRVVVACRVDSAGGDEAASRDRDRLLLAVRESLLARASLPEDIEIVVGDLAEETGAAAQDLRGRPLAAGQLTFAVAVLETLSPIPLPEGIDASQVNVTGHPAGTAQITPN